MTQQPYGPPGETRTETKAVIALVLAVLAYTPTVPFLGAIAALIVAHYSQRDIDASGGALTGRALLTWARVLAWVHLIFVVGLFLVVILAVLGVFTFTLFGVTFG